MVVYWAHPNAVAAGNVFQVSRQFELELLLPSIAVRAILYPSQQKKRHALRLGL